VSLASLIYEETKAEILARGLAIANSLGLTVTSWAAGDPTRALFHFVSEVLGIIETNVAGYVKSGFLDYAEGDWLTVHAEQVYGVTRTDGAYATSTVSLLNGGGGVYTFAAGDVTVRNSTTGKTYTNTSSGTLGPTGTSTDEIDVDVTADEVGTDSSAGANDIDEMVTQFLGVTVTASTTATGTDEEDDTSLRSRCRAKLGALSATGPADAFSSVVRDPDLTGVTDITRARVVGDTGTGVVTIYVASASGAVAGASVTAAQDAVEEWATPVCATPTVTNATGVTVAVTYSVWLYDSVGEETATITAAIADALGDVFSARPIGGDIVAPATTGKLYKSLVESTIRGVYPTHAFRVSVSAPSGDTSLAINEVAVLGTVTPTVTLEATP
jgi:phage-related baseplate assembly protein